MEVFIVKKLFNKMNLAVLAGFFVVVLCVLSCQISPDNTQNGVNEPIFSDGLSDVKDVRPYVVLYNDAGYSGVSGYVLYGNNVSDFAFPYGTFNNKISSIKCCNGAAVTLYDGANYNGTSITFTDDHPDFYYLDFNDVASSLKWLDKNVVTKIAAGHAYSMVIKGDCSLYAAGLNDVG